MNRWADLTGGNSGAAYAARFAELDATGADVHGEARFCASLLTARARVLDAGCGTGRVAIRLAADGHDCVGVDLDASMLAVARRTAPGMTWIQADLATLDLGDIDDFDLVVAAGNVIPLLAPGTEPAAVGALAAALRPGGLLVAGFGLDAAHLPVPPSADLAGYDLWCEAAGLTLEGRFATWDGDDYHGGGYAVSIHRRVPALPVEDLDHAGALGRPGAELGGVDPDGRSLLEDPPGRPDQPVPDLQHEPATIREA